MNITACVPVWVRILRYSIAQFDIDCRCEAKKAKVYYCNHVRPLTPIFLYSLDAMPVEPKTKSYKRPNRREPEDYKFDGSHAREMEIKRKKGEISCAECRRCGHRTISFPPISALSSSCQAQDQV
jgi:hypothetical protein